MSPWSNGAGLTARVPYWWHSATVMRRMVHSATIIATLGFIVGITTWSSAPTIAILALVCGTASVPCALFAWFRGDHLRELGRLGR